MKKFLALTTVLLLAMANAVFAETPVKTFRHLDRGSAERAFEQLTKNAQRGLLAPNAVKDGKFVAIDATDFPPDTGTSGEAGITNVEAGTGNSDGNADSQPVNVPITTGMRVWFELTDGKLINPSVYRFKPGEEFFVHVESAVPVFVTLHQHFPDREGKDPIIAYPDKKFESSYRILNPAVRTKLFTKFAMDDNYEAEYMSLVVVRADWDKIAGDVPAAAITAVELAKADSPEGYEAIYRKIIRGIADISKPVVLDRFAAISKQVDWNWVEEEEEFRYPWQEANNVTPIANNNGTTQPEIATTPRPETGTDTERSKPVQFVFTNYRVPPPQWDGVSNEVNDVANYLFSNTSIGQLQIVLNKIEPVAP